MDKMDTFKKIVNENLNDMDISDNAKRELRQRTAAKKPHKATKTWKLAVIPALAVVLVCALLFTNVFMNPTVVNASENLMDGIVANKQQAKIALDAEFISATEDFSVKLFQNSVTQNKNSLVSPTSVYLALGMTANGANQNTKKQFEALLGGGQLSVDQLNSNYYTLAQKLQSIQNGKMKIANSIWYRQGNDLQVQPNFLQKNANFFGAGAFQLDFTKQDTVTKINNWVKKNTDGMIDKMVDKIDSTTMMYLINTLLFEADWLTPYQANNTQQEIFHAVSGNTQASYMSSSEIYLHDQTAQGFIKKYKDDRFSFVAILPNEGVSLSAYVKSMTGKKFAAFLKSQGEEYAETMMPKFKYDYQVDLSNPLKVLGLSDGFNAELANFSKMGTCTGGNLYIADVLHKTYIQVDELGTKAGAATKVEMIDSAAMLNPKTVKLDRPFVYAIVDNQSGLPIFLGTVEKP